jgi:hypothetical protein
MSIPKLYRLLVEQLAKIEGLTVRKLQRKGLRLSWRDSTTIRMARAAERPPTAGTP